MVALHWCRAHTKLTIGLRRFGHLLHRSDAHKQGLCIQLLSSLIAGVSVLFVVEIPFLISCCRAWARISLFWLFRIALLQSVGGYKTVSSPPAQNKTRSPRILISTKSSWADRHDLRKKSSQTSKKEAADTLLGSSFLYWMVCPWESYLTATSVFLTTFCESGCVIEDHGDTVWVWMCVIKELQA